MKRAPSPRPEWIELCHIQHSSGNVIDFPMIQDLASLLWVVNLGCIDLNQWYARCDDVDRPDYLHFDLDPVPNASFEKVIETALLLRQGLESLKMPCFAKTTGSKGIHVYCANRTGANAKTGLEFRQGVFACTGCSSAKADNRGLRGLKKAEGHCAGGLQPECLGSHTRFNLTPCGRAQGPLFQHP